MDTTKTSRSVLIWATLALCGVMVLEAMTCLNRAVLAAESKRAGADARADLEECTRLALWRMDAAGAALVAGENRHPPADYQPSAFVFLAIRDSLAILHFKRRESGTLTSPEATESQPQLKCAADASDTAWSQVPKDAP